MIAAALAALKGIGLVQCIWNHRVWLKWAATGLAIALLCGLWRWERHERIAAEAIASSASAGRDLAEGDAKRWRDASGDRDAAIAQLNGLIAQQNAAVEKLRLSLDVADLAAAQGAAASRAESAQLEQRIKELNDEAKAHPENVSPLGDIVRNRVDRLWD